MINPSMVLFEANNVINELNRQLAAKEKEIERLKGVIRTAIEHGKRSEAIDTVDALYARLKHLYNL